MPDKALAGIARRRALRRTGLALPSVPAALDSVRAEGTESPPWMLEQGAPVTNNPYGVPSPSEKSVARIPGGKPPFPTSAHMLTPLQDLDGIIAPNGLHHVRDHGGTPTIDPDRHRLLVHGMVDRPLSFGIDDLTRFPSVSRIHFLECSGNTPLYKSGKPDWSVQMTRGLVSCPEWTGVRLSDVLAT